MDISVLGSLPQNYTLVNNGWPIFLSGFFSVFSFENSISYMELQRIISVIISTLTIIPIYYLCKKFVNNSYSIIGAAIFAFEPRIIHNSLFGIGDPLYIFLVATSLGLIFGVKEKFVYLAFVSAAFASIVRSEGLFLFIAISIIFILKNRKKRSVFLKYILAGTIFFLLLMPILSYRIDVSGTDGMFFRISNTLINGFDVPEEIDPNWVTPPRSLPDAILTSLENFPKYLIWDLIPIFIFFVPVGIIFLFREINLQKIGIIISIISMSLPAVFAYSLPLKETRYFYFLYPLFCVVSVIGLPNILKRFKKENLIMLLLLVGIIISSSIFMQFKMIDKEHEMESYKVAKFIVENAKGVNQFHPEYVYIESAEIPELTQDLQAYFLLEREDQISIRHATLNNTQTIPTKGFDSLNEFIKYGQSKGLTHIVIDDKKDRQGFFKDVLANEEKYPFLIKKYDSDTQGFSYHVKIFEINHSLFNTIEKNINK